MVKKRSLEARESSSNPAKRSRTTNFLGVSSTRSGKWQATRFLNRKSYHCGTYESAKEAAHAADDLLRKLNRYDLQLNFPKKGEKEKRRQAIIKSSKHGFMHIVKHKERWQARVHIRGRSMSGPFRDALEDCAKDADAFQRTNGGDYCHLNFPSESERKTEQIERIDDASNDDEEEESESSEEESTNAGDKPTKFSGVHVGSGGTWSASRKIKGHRYYSGGHETAEDAAHASDEFVRKRKAYYQRLNFPKKGEKEKRRKARMKSSKYKFIHVVKADTHWKAKICIQGKAIYGPRRKSRKKSALDADQLEREHGGDYLNLNFPSNIEIKAEKIGEKEEESESSEESETIDQKQEKDELIETDSSDENEDKYEVEAIISDRVNKKNQKQEYLVKWKGYVKRTWEPARSLSHLPMYQNYIQSKKVNDSEQAEPKSSRYTCVNWCKRVNKWKAALTQKGTYYFCGYHAKQLEAAKAINRKCQELEIPPKNELQSSVDSEHTKPKCLSWCKKKKKWRAEFQHQGKRYYCGIHSTKLEAVRAINRKCHELKIQQKNELKLPDSREPSGVERTAHLSSAMAPSMIPEKTVGGGEKIEQEESLLEESESSEESEGEFMGDIVEEGFGEELGESTENIPDVFNTAAPALVAPTPPSQPQPSNPAPATSQTQATPPPSETGSCLHQSMQDSNEEQMAKIKDLQTKNDALKEELKMAKDNYEKQRQADIKTVWEESARANKGWSGVLQNERTENKKLREQLEAKELQVQKLERLYANEKASNAKLENEKSELKEKHKLAEARWNDERLALISML